MYSFLKFVFLYSLCSFHIQIGVGLKLYADLILPNIILWIKLKGMFLTDFHTYFQVYLKSTQASTMELFSEESFILDIRLPSKYATDFHNNNIISLVV